VIQVDPKNGKLLRKVDMPVKKITSVAFGGPDLDILYVTSANENNSNSGCLFSIKGLGVKGFPSHNFKYTNSYK
jgi:sugar lactone lactonase YvrE